MKTQTTTLKQAKAELRAVGMTVRRTDAGDYRVSGRGFSEAQAYYTDDLTDAVVTGRSMVAARAAARTVTPECPRCGDAGCECDPRREVRS